MILKTGYRGLPGDYADLEGPLNRVVPESENRSSERDDGIDKKIKMK